MFTFTVKVYIFSQSLLRSPSVRPSKVNTHHTALHHTIILYLSPPSTFDLTTINKQQPQPTHPLPLLPTLKMLILMPLSLPVLHFEVLFVMFIAIGIFFSPALRVQNYPADTNPSTYQRVTAINPDGSCVSVPQVCDDGTIAPFDEEVCFFFLS